MIPLTVLWKNQSMRGCMSRQREPCAETQGQGSLSQFSYQPSDHGGKLLSLSHICSVRLPHASRNIEIYQHRVCCKSSVFITTKFPSCTTNIKGIKTPYQPNKQLKLWVKQQYGIQTYLFAHIASCKTKTTVKAHINNHSVSQNGNISANLTFPIVLSEWLAIITIIQHEKYRTLQPLFFD